MPLRDRWLCRFRPADGRLSRSVPDGGGLIEDGASWFFRRALEGYLSIWGGLWLMRECFGLCPAAGSSRLHLGIQDAKSCKEGA